MKSQSARRPSSGLYAKPAKPPFAAAPIGAASVRDEFDAVYSGFAETAFALTEIERQMLAQIRRRAFPTPNDVWIDRIELAT
jgi:hypothetical protein